ncbi:Lipase [Entamoeba histolytica HM-3:IMSS]|uniref:Lipase n=3 Tax=Entamoeba histolytica TaxID=5759 RepID=M7WC90_ENTHI|nr:Lipase [Entamoeba histolytica HM-3:IMSS]
MQGQVLLILSLISFVILISLSGIIIVSLFGILCSFISNIMSFDYLTLNNYILLFYGQCLLTNLLFFLFSFFIEKIKKFNIIHFYNEKTQQDTHVNSTWYYIQMINKYDGIILLFFSVFTGMIISKFYVKKHQVTRSDTQISYVYIISGILLYMIYFIFMIIFNFIRCLVNIKKEGMKGRIIQALMCFVPFYGQLKYINEILFKRLPMIKTIINFVLFIISIILFILFINSLYQIIDESYKQEKNMFYYCLLFTISIISCFIHCIHQLRNSQENNQDGCEEQQATNFHFDYKFYYSEILHIILLCTVIVSVLILQQTITNNNKNEQYNMNNYITKMIYNELNDETEIERLRNDIFEQSHLCGRDVFGIKPIEYSCLSYLAYSPKMNDINQTKIITEYLKKRFWEVEKQHNDTVLTYVLGYNSKNKIKVISFKGTDSPNDLISDIKLFGEVVFPAFFVKFIPIYNEETIQKVSYVMSLFGSQAFPTHYDNIINIAKNVVKKYNETTIPIVLTGHSLGGAIANIVGSDLGLSTFGISTPGIYSGTKNFGIKKKSVNTFTRTLIPENDFISSMGRHGGEQINLPCYEHFWKCHGIKNTLCAISVLCHEKEMHSLCKEEWNKWNFNSTTW